MTETAGGRAGISDINAYRKRCNLALGLLAGPTKDRIADGAYRRYYMHRTSHWLGHDVHDVRNRANLILERLLAPKEFDAPLATVFETVRLGAGFRFEFGDGAVATGSAATARKNAQSSGEVRFLPRR